MIIDTLRSTIKTYGLLSRGDTVVIGVSGGPDSLALLHLLHGIKKEYSLTLHVAHLDHKLRKSSSQDSAFVEQAAKSLHLPFSGGAVNLRKPSEETCRLARHEFLFKIAKTLNADSIALGHTLDDQAETVLMRLIRGTGLLGLAGIAPKRNFGDFTVIRPLIELPRAEIEKYLKRKGLRPRIDETNCQDIFLRNRIRAELLPLLEKKYNRNIKQLLGNLAQNTGNDYDYLLRSAEKDAGGIKPAIGLARFARLHPSIKAIVLRRMAERVQGDTRRLTARHIRELEDLARNRPAGSIVDLPKELSVKKTQKNLCFYRSYRA